MESVFNELVVLQPATLLKDFSMTCVFQWIFRNFSEQFFAEPLGRLLLHKINAAFNYMFKVAMKT